MSGFFLYMPIIIVGAILQIISNLVGLFSVNAAEMIEVMYNLTFGLLALLLAYSIGHALAEQHEVDPVVTGLVSVCAFLILQRPLLTPTDSTGMVFQIDTMRIGATGLFVSIVAGLFTGEIMGQFLKHKWTIKSDALPDFVARWFEPIVPVSIVIITVWVVAYVLNIDLQNYLTIILTPLLTASDNFWAFILLAALFSALFTVGINAALTFGILLPLWFATIGENAALVASGLAPIHINTIQTSHAFIVLGGTGATLMLNLMMLRSKSESLRAFGKAAIIPSLMNINEPLIFGLPIAFNPILAIPFIIAPTVNAAITHISMSLGLVAKPFVPMLIPWMPIPFKTYLTNQDWRGMILLILLLVLDWLIYYPFFKIHEKRTLEKEKIADQSGTAVAQPTANQA
jgi:PTS system cellobiose-specific IIC component